MNQPIDEERTQYTESSEYVERKNLQQKKSEEQEYANQFAAQ
jgi:hypothetical protein